MHKAPRFYLLTRRESTLYENINPVFICKFFFLKNILQFVKNSGLYELKIILAWLWKVQVSYFQSVMVSFFKFLQRRSPLILLNIIFFQCCLVLFGLLNKFPSYILKQLDEVDITECLEFIILKGAIQKHIIAFYSMQP